MPLVCFIYPEGGLLVLKIYIPREQINPLIFRGSFAVFKFPSEAF